MFGRDFDSIKNNVIGKKIADITYQDDENVILWFADVPKGLHLNLEGDCCSHSYFADRTHFTDLIGTTINDVEHRSNGSIDEEYFDVTSLHCLVFITDKGHFTIDWRNDSNGYYDGWVNFLIVDM